MEQQLIDLANAVKSLAPQIWNIYIKQVHVEAITYLVEAIVTFLVVLYTFKQVMQQLDEWGDEFAKPALTIVFGLVLSLGIVFMFLGLGRVYNPEYYAIQLLLESIP